MDDPMPPDEALLSAALAEAQRALIAPVRVLQQRRARLPLPARTAAWRQLAASLSQLQGQLEEGLAALDQALAATRKGSP
jgi:hypothetical protein